MLANKTFHKKTKKGKILKVVTERYLRDDIPCGSETCVKCRNTEIKLTKNLKEQQHERDGGRFLVLDTNVVLHQIDLLEHPQFIIRNVIITKTVLEEVKHRNQHYYTRLREIISKQESHFFVFDNEFFKDTYIERLPQESPNDRNDRAIRVVAKWYSMHLPGQSVLLLTNDNGNLQKAKQEEIPAQTIHSYVEQYCKDTDMSDILVDQSDSTSTDDSAGKINYPEYLSASAYELGLKNGTLYQGPLRMNRDNYLEGGVPSQALDEDILIQGLLHLNRAINSDIVVVELLPKDQWTRPSKKMIWDKNSMEAEQEEKEDAINTLEKLETKLDRGENVNDEQILEEKGKEKEKEKASNIPKRPTGRVVAVIKTNWKPYVGNLVAGTNTNSQFSLFESTDRCIPRIRIKTKQAANLINKRIVVCIDVWSKNSRYPSGHYVRTIGAVGDKETETEVLLLQHDIPFHPFSDSVMACLPSPNWLADTDADTNTKHRVDLRHLNVVSVDPPGCTDIDDALHIHKLPNGNFEVGVHIADVTHFVKEDTPLDEEAANRSTTVYLVNKRIDMLPHLLGTNLCSLMSDVDRYAFSVIWEITPDAEILSSKFMKTIIRSRMSFTYEQAQLKIDDTRLQDDISVSLRNLLKLSKILKQRRTNDGALTLASMEVKFEFESGDRTQDPIEVGVYQMRETNSMIEEFMLLANVEVGKKIYDHFPSFAMLRRHPIPNPKNFEKLLESARHRGVEIDVQNNKALADSIDKAKLEGNPFFNTLLRMLTTRCMSQAVYFSSGTIDYPEFYHYGLAMPIYTHFTSPIRRYADVIVHRLLACAIGIFPLSKKYEKHAVQKTAEVINYRHKMAQDASSDSASLHTLIFFKGKKIREDAYVMRLKENGFVVIVPKYGIEEIIYLAKRGEKSKVEYNEEKQLLFCSSFELRVFDKVTVEITVDEEKNKLNVKCIEPDLDNITSTSSSTPSTPKSTDSKVNESNGNSSSKKRERNETNNNETKTKKQLTKKK